MSWVGPVYFFCWGDHFHTFLGENIWKNHPVFRMSERETTKTKIFAWHDYKCTWLSSSFPRPDQGQEPGWVVGGLPSQAPCQRWQCWEDKVEGQPTISNKANLCISATAMAESSFKLCRDLFFLTWNITCDCRSFNQLFDWWRVYNLRTWVVNRSLNVNLTDFLVPRWPGFETCQMQDGEPSIRSPYHIISYQIVTIIVSILTSFWGMLLHVPWVPHHLLVQMLFKLNLHGFEKIQKAFNLNRFLIILTLISRLSVSPPGWSKAQCSRSLADISSNLSRTSQMRENLSRASQMRWERDQKAPFSVGGLVLESAQHDLHHVEPEHHVMSRGHWPSTLASKYTSAKQRNQLELTNQSPSLGACWRPPSGARWWTWGRSSGTASWSRELCRDGRPPF